MQTQTETTTSGESLLGEVRGDLRKFIARRIQNPADVDDVLQEVLIKIHRSADKLSDENNLFAWVCDRAESNRRPLPRASVDGAYTC